MRLLAVILLTGCASAPTVSVDRGTFSRTLVIDPAAKTVRVTEPAAAEAVPPQEPVRLEHELGNNLATAWRGLWEMFQPAATRAKYAWPLAEKLVGLYPQAAGSQVLEELKASHLREWFARQFALAKCAVVPVGNREYGLRLWCGRQPCDTLILWLADPAMAPGGSGPSPIADLLKRDTCPPAHQQPATGTRPTFTADELRIWLAIKACYDERATTAQCSAGLEAVLVPDPELMAPLGSR